MKEGPILFSGAMVRAILDGRKTMTRRVVGRVHPAVYGISHRGDGWFGFDAKDEAIISQYSGTFPLHTIHCPYGMPGDRLWVRETWFPNGNIPNCLILHRADAMPGYDKIKWRPSIFMPRFLSRITLQVTAIRVERLQDISDEDAVAEGMAIDDALHDYQCLWDRLNAKRGYGWDKNPWVWVIQFERLIQT